MNLNCYTYDELQVGHTETFSVAITEEMMFNFFRITGDGNPLHTDAAYAQQRGHVDRVAYGMLTASFMSTMAGVYLPGKYSLVHRSEAEFPTPVNVGDTLVFVGEVVEKNDHFKTIELKITARNSDGKKVLRGKMRVGVLE